MKLKLFHDQMPIHPKTVELKAEINLITDKYYYHNNMTNYENMSFMIDFDKMMVSITY